MALSFGSIEPRPDDRKLDCSGTVQRHMSVLPMRFSLTIILFFLLCFSSVFSHHLN